LFGPRVFVTGIHHVPSGGPTVLVTASRDPAVHAAIMSSTDRWTRFMDGQGSPAAAQAVLDAGGIVGISLDASGERLLQDLKSTRELELLPVFAERQSRSILVAIGTAMPASLTPDEMQSRIAEARYAADHHG
jgi:hypothetical protein